MKSSSSNEIASQPRDILRIVGKHSEPMHYMTASRRHSSLTHEYNTHKANIPSA